MQIKGRGRFTGNLTPTPTGVHIRLDDTQNESWWAEVELGREELQGVLDAALCNECGLELVEVPEDYLSPADGGWGCLCSDCDDSFAEMSILAGLLPEGRMKMPF